MVSSNESGTLIGISLTADEIPEGENAILTNFSTLCVSPVLMKKVSGENKENKVAITTTTMIASRAVFKVDFLPINVFFYNLCA